MIARARGWVVLAGAGVAALTATGVTGIVVRDPIDGWPLLLVSWPVVGGLVVVRRPDSLVGRLLVLFATGFATAIALEYYLLVTLEGAGRPADLLLWLSAWLFAPVLLALIYLVAVFPTGRVASAWMRWPLGAAVVVTGLSVVARMALPVPVATETGAGLVNPWAIDALTPLLLVEELLGSGMTALLVVAMVDLALRWRRSAGVERLQMRWLALALLLFALLLLVTGLVRLAGLSPAGVEVADTVAWLAGLSLLPVAIGVAVTRYRLFEIDRLISRTVTYGMVVAMLVAVWVAGLLVVSSLLPRQSDLGVAASTLAAAALFNPLRRRVQRGIERRFNRARYDGERQLVRFAGRLRDELDLDAVGSELVRVATTTVQPATASLWLRHDADGELR